MNYYVSTFNSFGVFESCEIQFHTPELSYSFSILSIANRPRGHYITTRIICLYLQDYKLVYFICYSSYVYGTVFLGKRLIW